MVGTRPYLQIRFIPVSLRTNLIAPPFVKVPRNSSLWVYAYLRGWAFIEFTVLCPFDQVTFGTGVGRPIALSTIGVAGRAKKTFYE